MEHGKSAFQRFFTKNMAPFWNLVFAFLSARAWPAEIDDGGFVGFAGNFAGCRSLQEPFVTLFAPSTG